MANCAPTAHHISPAQCDVLVNAVCRGDVAAARRVLDADPLGYLKRGQMKALFKACDVTAPKAVDLLTLFRERRHTLFRRSHRINLDMALARATEHIAKCLNEYSAVELERRLVWATSTRNFPHVVGAAIKTNDQPFVLRFMGTSAVQTFLASLEATFEPCFIRHGVARRRPFEWLDQAMKCNMHAVVAMAAERCPLVTADVAFAHCALFPADAAKYADLCARRAWLNCQIDAFHQAIQAGNVDVVGAMLEEVPVLRRSSMDNHVSALMASSLAPNSIALLESLLDGSTTNFAVVQALVHACEHGAAVASIAHLWNWVEALDRNDRRRDYALWKAVNGATSSQHLVAVALLLPRVREWRTIQARDFLKSAIETENDEFACAVMELPVVEAFFKTLDNKGHGAVPSVNVDTNDDDECDCTHDETCAEIAFCSARIVSDWVYPALHQNLRRVAHCLDKWWPAVTRHAAFLCSYKNSSKNAIKTELNQRYVRDVTWPYTRDAYLVQRRVLPGLDHVGRHIATYLYAFNARDEHHRWWYSP